MDCSSLPRHRAGRLPVAGQGWMDGWMNSQRIAGSWFEIWGWIKADSLETQTLINKKVPLRERERASWKMSLRFHSKQFLSSVNLKTNIGPQSPRHKRIPNLLSYLWAILKDYRSLGTFKPQTLFPGNILSFYVEDEFLLWVNSILNEGLMELQRSIIYILYSLVDWWVNQIFDLQIHLQSIHWLKD